MPVYAHARRRRDRRRADRARAVGPCRAVRALCGGHRRPAPASPRCWRAATSRRPSATAATQRRSSPRAARRLRRRRGRLDGRHDHQAGRANLIPLLRSLPDQLTAANVVVGWVEATAITGSGLLTGLLISARGIASVFAACACVALLSCGLVARLRARASLPPWKPACRARGPPRGGTRSCRAAWAAADPGPADRRGRRRRSLDLLFVILAVTVLGRPEAGRRLQRR